MLVMSGSLWLIKRRRRRVVHLLHEGYNRIVDLVCGDTAKMLAKTEKGKRERGVETAPKKAK